MPPVMRPNTKDYRPYRSSLHQRNGLTPSVVINNPFGRNAL